jgi:hypothetical protein
MFNQNIQIKLSINLRSNKLTLKMSRTVILVFKCENKSQISGLNDILQSLSQALIGSVLRVAVSLSPLQVHEQ